jgi:hypothetical protein
MTRATDIVVTTIFEPAWLQGYLDNIARHGHKDHVTLRIICDRKTPATVLAAAARAASAGFKVDCPTLDEQAEYLRKVGAPDDLVPWNTDNRRNIGFLRAWQAGAEVLISIDDDNYCRADSDFIGAHHVVGAAAGAHPRATYAGGAPWFNPCSLLDFDSAGAIYPRGYPYPARRAGAAATPVPLPEDARNRAISINAGLWLDDPDVDALTRIALAPRARAAPRPAVVLAPETWSPINTQNTALVRDAIPAYYYVRMGYPLRGLRIDRFGDILSGYFVQKCAKHLGHAVRFGSPVADHRRSPHDLFKDLYHELAGIVVVDEVLPWLQELKLAGGNYAEAYASLADALAGHAQSLRGFIWDDGGREFLVDTAQCMRTWLKLVNA